MIPDFKWIWPASSSGSPTALVYSVSSVGTRWINSRPSYNILIIVPADLGFGMSCALNLDAEESRGRASSSDLEVWFLFMVILID